MYVVAGANNVFNIYPDRLRDYRNTGDGVFIYGQEATPFGFNGGYYFVRLNVSR
jgi:iron complex outermembrane receptor protein